jgi:periodic tryptophan protein 1
MISALGWIRRSAAATRPTRNRLTEADYAQFMASATENLDRAREEAEKRGIDLNERVQYGSDSDSAEEEEDQDDVEMGNSKIISLSQTPPSSPVDELAKYKMDDYDQEDEDVQEAPLQVDAVFTPLHELVHPEASSDEEDPMQQDSDEENDLTLQASDALFVAARTEDEVPQLEIYVFEQDPKEGDNCYVHHDIMLGSFPLCLEWLSHPCSPDNSNFVAVGTFEPEIEIWNLDVIDVVYPEITLKNGHEDAVMSLAWNRGAGNFLCSGGADRKVLLWDLNAHASGPLRSFNHARDKVQSLAWNPLQPSILASAAYDRIPCVFDVRSPDSSLIRLPKLAADPEQIKWHSEFKCAVADESGRVSFFDTRSPAHTSLVIDAHTKSVSCLDFCPVQSASGASIFLTASSDKSVKVWGMQADGAIQELCSKSVGGIGKVFAGGFLADAPLVIAAGGSRGVIETWNLRAEDVVLNFLK